MDKIIGVIVSLPRLLAYRDDDFSDRLSYWYTAVIQVVFAVIVTSKQFVGDAISCWVPAHFTSNHEEYANNYCWVRNTYYQPFNAQVPLLARDREQTMVHYYQWVPVLLLVQALLFHLPIDLWRTLNSHCGVDISNIVECGRTFSQTDMMTGRETMLRYMTKQLDRFLTSQQQSHYLSKPTVSCKHCFSRTCCLCCGRIHGNYLVTSYIFIKLLFLLNVVGQLLSLNLFLGRGFHLFGLEVIRSLLAGRKWTNSPRFPRVTLCDFKIRRFVNVQQYTVQCVLPINLFNEKIFLFLWFWLVFVGIVTVLSLLVWSLRFAFHIDRQRYVKKHLQLLNKLQSERDKRLCKRFVGQYLRQDGVFILRLVGHNTNAITVTELVGSLWDNYCSKHVDSGDHGDDSDFHSHDV